MKKKLVKRAHSLIQTVEAYATCVCTGMCTCGCGCYTYCSCDSRGGGYASRQLLEPSTTQASTYSSLHTEPFYGMYNHYWVPSEY